MPRHRWCSGCMTAYMREYRPRRDRHKAQAEFNRGVAAMREVLVRRFRHIGESDMNGYTAAQIALRETISE